MTTRILPDRCWYVQCPDGSDTPLDGDPQPHYDEAGARKEAAEVNAAEDVTFYRAAQYDKPCLIADCDHCGKEAIDYDRGWTIHWPDADAVAGDCVWCEESLKTAAS